MRRRSVKNRNQLRRRLIQCESLEDRRLLAPVIVSELEPNNFVREAQVLTLGTATGRTPEVTVTGTFDGGSADYYKFDLSAGDVFSTRVTVGGTNTSFNDIDISLGKVNANGTSSTEMRGNNSTGDLYLGGQRLVPASSPVLTGGDVYFNYVIPSSGTYSFRVGTGNSGANPNITPVGSYQLEFQTLRSPLEAEPIGTHQILFLDFDGGFVDLNDIDETQFGSVRLPSLAESLYDLGFEVTNEDRLIDVIVAEMEENFGDVATFGTNGDYDATGVPGQYKLQILNSRDHEDPWGLPNVSRLMMTGAGADLNIVGAFGIAPSLDVGNFDTEETAFIFAEEFFGLTNVGDVFAVPHSISVSTVDMLGKAIGLTATHEAGHFFGLRHTNNANASDQMIDTGGDLPGRLGVGPDGIFGTVDDLDTDFGTDTYDTGELDTLGIQDSINTLAYSLATGTAGGSISGFVFNDANGDGRSTSDIGLAGVTVFGDLDSDGVLDPGEPRAVTGTSGTYSLGAVAGTFPIIAQVPSNYSATTATSVVVTTVNGTATGPNFGFKQVLADITGVKWNDTNGNGVRDAGEPGIGGVYIYIDTDGDDRIDLFEPQAITAADGTYSLQFPGPGTYTVREVVEPGFRQIFPASGEHIVTYDGTQLIPNTNLNFGNQAARDFGDLPAPYSTLLASNGASHGFSSTLGLGSLTDIEADGIPSTDADGDDNNGSDDEDGIVIVSPLAPGATADFSITARNIGQTAYLQGWIDFNGDGVFSASEKVFSNRTLFNGAQTLTTEIAVPAGTTDGPKYARFRYGPELNLGTTGFSTAGEVEDYVFTVQATTSLAQPDRYDDLTNPVFADFTIPRNSLNANLRVLENDSKFDSSIRVVSVDPLAGTTGTLNIGSGGQSVIYTPRSGFTGEDTFEYTVITDSGLQATTTVTVNIVLLNNAPIAVDDLYQVPLNASAATTLAVLANDSPSNLGGLQIVDVGPTNFGGTVNFASQTLSYLPAPGFSGTEQFTYTVRDSSGFSDTATVTVQINPNSLANQVEYSVRTLDANGNPTSSINVGDTFKVQVWVDDIRASASILEQGLGAAYIDLLYSNIVTTVAPTAPGNTSSFDITYGPLFQQLKTGNALTPNMIDEVGASQASIGNQQFHSGPAELFTLTMRAIGAGTAVFQTDPADEAITNDVVFLNDPGQEVPVNRQLFGKQTLNIIPAGLPIPTAVDDSYRVSQGAIEFPMLVLGNDIQGAAGASSIAAIGTPANGSARVSGNTILYTPRTAFTGVDQFTYTILSPDGFRSTATITVFVGTDAQLNANDTVDLPFTLFDASGNAILDAAGNQIRTVRVGDTLTLQVNVDDLRTGVTLDTGVFSAYQDILYSASTLAVSPRSTTQTSALDFNIEFGEFYTNVQRGTAGTVGIINEVGATQFTNTDGSGAPLGSQLRDLMAIQFVATATGIATFVGDPADISPAQDTLLFEADPKVVPIDQIRYDRKSITISAATTTIGPEYQNPVNRYDVNNDGTVSPIDALSVINQLNLNGSSQLMAEGESANANRRFVDVNGDQFVSPIDALMVINALNNQAGLFASGEAPSIAASVTAESEAPANDQVFAELAVEKTSQFDSTTSSDAASLGWLASTDSDDEEDAIDQFVDDITQEWGL
ncbi:Serine-aspartate repeat-containing protein D precursor [Rosistilla carotiformis]|uniref:Serine-aspartate repeat-containing protein D n=1 Tax=Rosistilla carotiformis TaxID=2528017 RepID=A0A518JRV8_9BACT|nr:tandem-95 repeat protein [Rosistilla carotiformis]QDV68274.1 Serine-aspartate repeat-containing protein D precursor [Rosistilla carotiformis]